MRLIDADSLKPRAIKVSTCDSPHKYMKAVGTHEIDKAPTIDAEPVRHGRWIYKGGHYDEDSDFVLEHSCSVCGRFIQVWTLNDLGQYPYCNCGAKMNLEVDNEAD